MVSPHHPVSKQTKTDQPPRSWWQQQAHEQEGWGTAPEAPRMMINEDCPLPSPVEAGPFLVSGFIEFELKGSMRYHLSAVSAWSGVSSKQQSSFLTRNPNKGQVGQLCMRLGSPRESCPPAPLLPSPKEAQVKPPSHPFHNFERSSGPRGSQGRARPSLSPWEPSALGPPRRGGAGDRWL